jgi:Putative Ig domain
MSAALTVGDASTPGEMDTLAPAMVGDEYSTPLTASGGSGGGYKWALLDAAMPPGLNLDENTGKIYGKPDVPEELITLKIQVTDATGATAIRDFKLTINPALQISRNLQRKDSSIQLEATGGSRSYTWEKVDFPDWLELNPELGVVTIEDPTRIGKTQFTVRVTDTAKHKEQASFSVIVRPKSKWRNDQTLRVGVKVRPKRLRALGRLSHLTVWLSIFAIVTPAIGAGLITLYALATTGPHLTYLAVGLLTAMAAFLTGCLTGFLFGIPRVVSSGQVRQQQSSGYAPSSNLAEVSDWLTKLLLGAGLVQLTHLAAPIADLIDHVAAGLHTTAASSEAAKVTAGAILFGYAIVGLLDGYVITTIWYQRRLAKLSL